MESKTERMLQELKKMNENMERIMRGDEKSNVVSIFDAPAKKKQGKQKGYDYEKAEAKNRETARRIQEERRRYNTKLKKRLGLC